MEVRVVLHRNLNRLCCFFFCKRIGVSLLAVDRDEIGFTVLNPRRCAVLEPFACEGRHGW